MSRWLAVLFVVIFLSLIVLPTGAEIPPLLTFGISPKSGGFVFPVLHHPFLRDYGTFSSRDSALPMERGFVPTGYVPGEKASLPFSFIPNTGQLNDPTILFVVKNRDSTLYFTREEVILAATRGEEEHGAPDVIRQSFKGADHNRVLMGAMELPQKTNFLVGQDPSRWRSNITTYGAVTYSGLYPGINLTYFGSEGHLKREFTVAPRANSSLLSFHYDGVTTMTVGSDGSLRLMTQGGEMRESRPVSYQMIGGQRKDVLSWYEITGPGTVHIATGDYDKNFPLVIDPKLDYSTYYGGSSDDGGLGGSNIFHQNNAITTDSSGNAYVTGFTQSHDFRTTAGVVNASAPGSVTPNDRDIFVLKLNAAGSSPVWATYYGGSSDDWGKGIAVDGSGNVYVTGYTISTDFLTTSGVVNATSIGSGNNNDVFIIKLNPSGSAPVYATYFGSSDGDESGLGLWVDGAGNAYITGETQSTDFYTTAGVLNTTAPSGGGGTDVFIVKLNPTASAPIYSTYYGGSAHDDEGHSIAVDTGGNAFVAGHTHANNFPTTTGAANTTKIGVLEDAFVLKINPTATAVLYSTYYGGTQDDIANGIAIDTAGNAYVTGQTRSTDFRVTAGSVNTSKIGGTTGSPDAFVFKLNNDGSAPVWATYYGGTNEDYGQSIARGSSGDLFITGITRSLNFLVTSDAYQKTHGGGTYDAFLVRLKSDGSAPVYSTYFGGDQDDVGLSIALDSAENAYVTGSTLSTNFPASSGAANSTRVGGRDAFIFKFFMNPPVSDFTANTTSGYTPQGIQFNDTSTSIGIQYWNWSFGDNTWFNTTDSSLRNATHTYTGVSSYSINLTITNATTSDTKARLNYVNVSAPLPIPAFTGNTTTGYVPQGVLFNDTTLTTNIISWNWSFGDNSWFNTTDSSLRNITHTYASDGSFTVSLHLTNSSGLAVPTSNTNTTTRSSYIVIAAKPIPDFTGSPTSGDPPLSVQFNDTTLSPGITLWNWSFGDNSWFNTTDSSLRNATHSYAAQGSYTVGLQLTNTSGTNTTSRSGYIVVGPPPPVPDFTGSPQSGTVPLSVQFNDTSLSPGITAWNWSLGGGIWVNTTDSILRNTTHTYTVAGTYQVALSVTNSSGTNTTSRAGFITANPVPTTTQAGSSGSGAGASSGSSSSSGSKSSGAVKAALPQPGTTLITAPGAVPREKSGENPPSYYLTTTTIGILPPSLQTRTTDRQSFIMNRIVAEKAGFTVEIRGDRVTASQAGSTLVITGANLQETPAGLITGSVSSVVFVLQPDPAYVTVGTVGVTAQASLPSVPETAGVSITLTDLVPDQTLAGFRQAAAQEGEKIVSVGYTATFRKEGILMTGPGMIRMTVPRGWVDQKGGIESVRIARIGDDKVTEILTTSYTGNDANGNLNFEARTPRGLSIFGLVAVQCDAGTAGTCGVVTQAPGSGGNETAPALPFIGGAGAGYPPFMVVSLVILAFLVIVIIRKRRRRYDWLFMR